MKAQKEKRRAGESLHLLRKYIIMHVLVQICTGKTILMRSKMGMRNMLLDNGEKVVLLMKNLAKLCLCSIVLWKVELVIYEIGYLAANIS